MLLNYYTHTLKHDCVGVKNYSTSLVYRVSSTAKTDSQRNPVSNTTPTSPSPHPPPKEELFKYKETAYCLVETQMKHRVGVMGDRVMVVEKRTKRPIIETNHWLVFIFNPTHIYLTVFLTGPKIPYNFPPYVSPVCHRVLRSRHSILPQMFKSLKLYLVAFLRNHSNPILLYKLFSPLKSRLILLSPKKPENNSLSARGLSIHLGAPSTLVLFLQWRTPETADTFLVKVSVSLNNFPTAGWGTSLRLRFLPNPRNGLWKTESWCHEVNQHHRERWTSIPTMPGASPRRCMGNPSGGGHLAYGAAPAPRLSISAL